MFTGIVEELGVVVEVQALADSARIRIRGPQAAADAKPGASIAVNGVCLTAVDLLDGEFSADVMKETLERSNLGRLVPGSRVNLERPVRLSDRLDGHLVQGHVDGRGEVVSRKPAERWEILRIALPPGLGRYVVEKGSIAVDGVSLTVSAVGADSWFEVSLIPTTMDLTTLGAVGPGDAVNLEVDVLAKYVERLLSAAGSEAEADH